MNSTIKSGGLKELEFGGTSPCFSRRGVFCKQTDATNSIFTSISLSGVHYGKIRGLGCAVVMLEPNLGVSPS